ncbi:MAG: rhodanese-like domain-containing protein [Arenimonas sp.]
MLRLVLLSLILITSGCTNKSAMQPAELAESIKSNTAPLILDVRTPEEYAAGHVPGAILIPHDQVESRIAELGEPRPVVVYCKSGRRASLAETILEKHGFSVKVLDGSWQAWQAAKLPEEYLVKR